MTFDQAVRAALGLSDGYILDWRSSGCQLISHKYRSLLSCPHHEAIWQCEVIGPHTTHRWSGHLIAHERAGNGWSCQVIDRRSNDTQATWWRLP